ncbi:restriction endonuclease subunit S [Gallicola sp. Sow4_E12]|uniref:restriction endonuclease subunit S n=1 Tax=Gallicola sp. Sow4_E12 TaxID=3438785 RepID=UPI003F8E170E
MAKKKELTEEERLEKALVPESEWPYELPEGWKWVRLEDINSFTGKSIEPSKFPDEEFELYSVPSYDEDFPEILRGKEIGSSKKEVEKNDILLCKINPRINRVWIVTKYTEHRLIASSEWIHIRSKVLIPNYLMWYFRSGMFREFMLSNVSGVGGSLMRAQPKMVNKYVVPIAPIEKQLEIVKQIESLFSKLEEAKEKVESVLESSENRRSAILHKAFTGELTKKWREENGVSMDSWETYELGKLIETQYGYTESACLEEIGPKFLRITDIQEGSVNWNKVPYCKIDDKNFEKYFLQKRDIVVARTGATTGKSYLIRDEVNSVFASYLIRVTINNREKLDEDYLYQYFQSPLYWEQITDLSQGIALPGVNAKKLKTMKVPIPSLEEQLVITERAKRTIVRVIEIETICNDNLKKIDFIKKMILSRMFGKKYS